MLAFSAKYKQYKHSSNIDWQRSNNSTNFGFRVHGYLLHALFLVILVVGLPVLNIVCMNTQYMMYKQQLCQIAAVAVASAVVDSAASEMFTNVLRLSYSGSPQQQAAQWTALVCVTVNHLAFSEGKSGQYIRRVHLGHATQADLLG